MKTATSLARDESLSHPHSPLELLCLDVSPIQKTWFTPCLSSEQQNGDTTRRVSI